MSSPLRAALDEWIAARREHPSFSTSRIVEAELALVKAHAAAASADDWDPFKPKPPRTATEEGARGSSIPWRRPTALRPTRREAPALPSVSPGSVALDCPPCMECGGPTKLYGVFDLTEWNCKDDACGTFTIKSVPPGPLSGQREDDWTPKQVADGILVGYGMCFTTDHYDPALLEDLRAEIIEAIENERTPPEPTE